MELAIVTIRLTKFRQPTRGHDSYWLEFVVGVLSSGTTEDLSNGWGGCTLNLSSSRKAIGISVQMAQPPNTRIFSSSRNVSPAIFPVNFMIVAPTTFSETDSSDSMTARKILNSSITSKMADVVLPHVSPKVTTETQTEQKKEPESPKPAKYLSIKNMPGPWPSLPVIGTKAQSPSAVMLKLGERGYQLGDASSSFDPFSKLRGPSPIALVYLQTATL
ncbi:hypothetical protein TNCV_2011731 [Trichonephila clavipes]|nr:hypothetical protein TNCV_2011731 [Trichonephila clavipes]